MSNPDLISDFVNKTGASQVDPREATQTIPVSHTSERLGGREQARTQGTQYERVADKSEALQQRRRQRRPVTKPSSAPGTNATEASPPPPTETQTETLTDSRREDEPPLVETRLDKAIHWVQGWFSSNEQKPAAPVKKGQNRNRLEEERSLSPVHFDVPAIALTMIGIEKIMPFLPPVVAQLMTLHVWLGIMIVGGFLCLYADRVPILFWLKAYRTQFLFIVLGYAVRFLFLS